jgi:type II secretory ATPase GspE/PulE/Tfp pilus assembly ATPase PilB-like protein
MGELNMTEEKKRYPKISAAIEREEVAFPKFLAKNFPRILQQIELVWGEGEAVNYFNSLLLNIREDRHGFPLEALREIALLKEIYDFHFPALEVNPHDPFSVARNVAPPKKIVPLHAAANATEFMAPPAQSEKTVSQTPPPAAAKATPRHGLWPKVRTQHELAEIAELRNSGKLYAEQGKPIGEILIHYGFIDEHTLRIVRHIQEEHEHKDQPIGEILVEIGIIEQEDLVCALCIQSGIVMADLLMISIPSETMKLIPSDKALEKQVVPIGNYNNTLYLAVADPFSFDDTSYFTMMTGLKLELVYVPRREIVSRLSMYGFGRSMLETKEDFRDLVEKNYDLIPSQPVAETELFESDISENDSTIINMVNKMIQTAIGEGASDIHIELFQNSAESEIRFRKDGRMENFSSFPRAYHPAVVSRIKIMARLDISERRRPQDGKIPFGILGGNYIDLRVATIPTMRGIEFVTIRILTLGSPLPLADLGMTERETDLFRAVSRHTHGLILVCGPTGSGKTTTLHSIMKELNTTDRKIWTVEDPVEIVQPHLCQVQVQSKIGLTFASILRSLLRADPDIIMIGEMRDEETAKIALEASMTGHLVLSTLHTNSASETAARLLDLNIDPYNLSDALLAILAQRLVRTLCSACKKREEVAAGELEELANEYHQSAYGKLPARAEREALIHSWHGTYGEEGKLYLSRPVGCKACNGGYKGRIGLYELLQVTPEVRRLIRHQSSAAEYQAAGVAEGMKTLKQDGIEKVLRGITDIEQVHSAYA